MDILVNIICVIQVRLSSNRLPCKAMLDLSGKTILGRVIESVSTINSLAQIYIATSNQTADDVIDNFVKTYYPKVQIFRGDLHNVLSRFYKIAESSKPSHILRCTADNPMLDINGIKELIKQITSSKNINYATFDSAYGSSAEIFTNKILKHEWEKNLKEKDLLREEHVTYYMKNSESILFSNNQFINLKTTIDTIQDYVSVQKFYQSCHNNKITPTLNSYKKYCESE